MRLRIYILSFNDETFNFANERYSNYDWAKVIKIETTVLFESIMYDSWLIDNFDDWKDFDYIGFLSWKVEHKIKLPDFDNIIRILDKNNSYEVIPLFFGYKFFINEHDYLYVILNTLFTCLNYPNNYVLTDFIPFYCNYWIARKDILIKYIQFFKRCKEVIDNNHIIQHFMWLDSKYTGGALSQKILIKIFNKPYYCYHPFIYERIPILFFHNKKFLF